MNNYKWLVIELDHDNSDLYCESFDNKGEALTYIEGLERKSILVYGEVEEYFT